MTHFTYLDFCVLFFVEEELTAEKNEEFIPPLPQDEVHPHYKHTCRDPEWRERMDYIKSNIIDLYKKCGFRKIR